MACATFAVVHQNDFVELRKSTLSLHDVAIVCCFGNGATFRDIWDDWDQSPAYRAHACINVKEKSLNQAKYVQGVLDTPNTHPDHLAGSDTEHTAHLLDGVVAQLTKHIPCRTWILHGASGGCVTAVSLARALLASGHRILGILADCGVPGSGEALPHSVPISIFRCSWDKYWNKHETHLFEVWCRLGYFVNHTSSNRKQHAWVVDNTCIGMFLGWFEDTFGLRI